jgi:hypothetical protein
MKTQDLKHTKGVTPIKNFYHRSKEVVYKETADDLLEALNRSINLNEAAISFMPKDAAVIALETIKELKKAIKKATE